MFGRAYFGGRYFAPRYFGGIGAAAAAVVAAFPPTPLHAIDILDHPTCAGGVIQARVIDAVVRQATFTVTGEDTFTVEVPAGSTAAPYLTSRYVARVQFTGDVDRFAEFRFLDDDTQTSRGGGRVTATAYDLLNDLAAPGPIRSRDATTGIENFTFSVEATPEELITGYILPRLTAKGYTWIAVGEIEPTTRQLWEWDRLNPLELLNHIATVTRMERRLRRNGTTSYLIDVVATINGDQPAVEVRPGINLQSFRRSRKGANHFTVLEGLGSTAQNGQRATIARAAWEVTAIDLTNDLLTLADPSGAGPGPIVEDDQYVHDGTAPGYLFRYGQGGLHRVLSSFVDTQQVGVDPPLGATYAVGDLVEIRGGAGATGTGAEYSDGWSTLDWWPKRVTAIDSGNKRLTVDDPFSTEDVIQLDDRYRGWTVRPHFRAGSSLVSSSTPVGLDQQVTVGSTTGMQAGDLALFTNSDPAGAPDWGTMTRFAMEVVSVDSGTLVTVTHRRRTDAVSTFGAGGFLSAWRARADRACTGCVAADETLDVNDLAAIVTGDLLELVRQYDGPLQHELASPLGVAAHGIRVGVFERDSRGERNLARNGAFDAWAGGANAVPDYFYATSKTFGLQNTDPVYLNNGVSSVRLVAVGSSLLSAAIGAGATSAVLIGGTGGRFEVGESVRLSAGLGAEETVVLTSVSANGLTIGFDACANAHALNDAVTAVATDTIPTIIWAGGTIITGSARLVTHPLDCPTFGTLDTYSLRVLVYPKGFATGDDVKVKLRMGAHGELGGTDQSTELVLDIGTTITADVWNEVVIPMTQPVAGGRVNVGVASDLTAGNTYPSDKALYVGAIGLTQTNYDPGVVAAYSFATALQQAANAKLALVSQTAPASYELSLVDLYGLDPATWPHLGLIPGIAARTTEPTASVAQAALRILKLHVDYDRPALARVEVGTRQQRLTEILASATVPVPVVRINADGTTDVLTDVSRQPLTFSGTGIRPITGTGIFTEA